MVIFNFTIYLEEVLRGIIARWRNLKIQAEEKQLGKDGVTFSIDSDTFIEEVVVDLRLFIDEYNHIRGTLIRLGVYSNKIRQSDLCRL